MDQPWTLALIVIFVGPFAVALVYGLRHRNSGTPKADDTLEAAGMVQTAKDMSDMRTGGRGW